MKTKIIVSTTLALLLATSGGVAAVKNKSGTTVTGTGSTSSPDKVLQAQGQADAPQGSPTWEIQQIEKVQVARDCASDHCAVCQVQGVDQAQQRNVICLWEPRLEGSFFVFVFVFCLALTLFYSVWNVANV